MMLERILKGALVAAAAVALCGGAVLAQQKTISIGTGGTGGVYYPLGGAMANVLTKYLPGVQATAEVTGGSVDALKGQDKFKSAKVPLQSLLVLYPNRMHVVTIEGTGVEKIADLKGKRVS